MKITKILNSSVVLALDNHNKEVIVMRKGIGYNNKAGNTFDEKDYDKIYVLKNKGDNLQLLSNTNNDILDASLKIYDLAIQTLKTELDKNLIIILADHIHFILKRHKNNQIFENKLFWEIKKYYFLEYQVALDALKIINNDLNIKIDSIEASNIAFHIINAESSRYDVKYISKMSELINDVIHIIKYHYQFDFNEETIGYIRLISHIKFLIHRLMENDTLKDNLDIFSYSKIKNTYKDDLICIEKITKYLENKLCIKITNNEKIYLLIHINRLKEDNKNV